ncbi:hypothetical protein N7481_009045 [Penicillium waksmanii]|uniref:uncharacterized protein n=1 Tax=Penicillium waksmanii TaxID=69791 RepID=UPI002547F09E|nr:uncharacterized protein N7481_009045 [Penicillium waksmanii]KAJ5975338.1 hypothetical protein N7481_009045 [Penicillium waksmanii]
MYGALLIVRQKLREYYKKTYRNYSFLYSTGTLLAPQYKLSTFDNREYSTYYEDTLKSTELNQLLELSNTNIFYKGVEYNEVDQYLREVLATGAGIERLFNSVQDIYYYRRGSLYKGTI